MKPTLDDAVQTILNTRDFCGDEQEALKDWIAENRPLSTQERMDVWRMVETVWRKSQIQSGAKIISPQQRAKAYAAINSGN